MRAGICPTTGPDVPLSPIVQTELPISNDTLFLYEVHEYVGNRMGIITTYDSELHVVVACTRATSPRFVLSLYAVWLLMFPAPRRR